MTYTPIAKGTQNWDVPLNAALANLDANITSSASGALQAASNLSDLTNAAQARTNLGIAVSAAADVSLYNVKDHGAVGNGVVDDTSALQYCLSLASGNGGGIVFLPPGNYKISNVLTTYNKVNIIGAGINATTITQASTTSHGITGVDLIYPSIRDLTLAGPASGSNKAGILFTLSSSAATISVTLENLIVKGFTSHGISIQNAIVSTFTKVTSQNNGGDGFHIVGQTFPSAAGTSCAFNACYANANGNTGYYLYNMVYSSLNGCAADANATAYWFDTCQSVAATGCGAESQVGGSFKISGGFGVGLYNCWIYQNNGIGIYVTGSAGSVVLSGCTDNTPAGGATNFIKVDSGSHVAMTMCHNTTANSLANLSTNILDDTAGGVDFQGYAFMANQLEVVGNITSDTGNLQAANFPSGAWTSWTPSWTTSSGSNTPAFGNATVDCAYTKFGRTVFFRINITFGSTTNFGAAPGTSDNWNFSLPVAAAHPSVAIGTWSGRPASATAVRGSLSTTSSTSTFQLNIDTGSPNAVAITNAGVADSLSPFTWASGNVLTATGFYETAS